MPGYVPRALERFSPLGPFKHQDSPHPWTAPCQQYATRDESPFLYYGRAQDTTMLHALGTIASQQSAPTELTMAEVKHFLDYTPPILMPLFNSTLATCTFTSTATHHTLSESHVRSRVAGFHYLSSDPATLTPGSRPPRNGSITVPCNEKRWGGIAGHRYPSPS